MNKIKCIHLSFVFLLMTNVGFAQVELGGEETKKEKKEREEKEEKEKEEAEEKKERVKDGYTEIYLTSNWSKTWRKLEINEGIFGDSLGEREFEAPLNSWSFSLGFRNQIKPYLSLQAGVSFIRNGESYLFEEPDTMYTYNTRYSYIAMPIKALFNFGGDLKFLVGGGITPQLFVGYRQDIEWRDSVDATDTETIKQKNGFSSFALSAALNLGVQYDLSESFSLLFLPEYRIQISDSYVKTDGYNHFGRALGFDIGLTYKL